MKKTPFLFYLSFMFALLYGCASTLPEKNMATTSFNKDHFKQHMVLINNSGEAIELSTINGLKIPKRSNQEVFVDSYIQAVVTKNTGLITYQINSLVEYKDHDKRLYKQVSYNTPTGNETKDANIFDHTISCQGSAYSGCRHTEHIVFTVDPELLESIADSYNGDTQSKWRYQLSPNTGRSHFAFLPLAEIAAIVEAATVEKTGHHFGN